MYILHKIFNKFNLSFNIYVSAIINIALCVVLPVVAMGMLTWGLFGRGFAIAYPISTLMVLFIPIVPLGDLVATKLGCQRGKVMFTIVSTAILALIVGTFMSLLMTGVNAGKYTGIFTPAYFHAWIGAYPWALLSVYGSALVGIFTGLPLMMKLCGPPPGMPPQSE